MFASPAGGAEGVRYSAFISYNHRDRRWAIWLHRALEQYRIPKRLQGRQASFGKVGERLPSVFRDRDELASSADLAEAVKKALTEAATLVVICSPHSAKSRWVDEEIRTFIALGRKRHIRLVIVDGEPHAADPALECLPPAILEDSETEPLAADARKGQDGKTGAKLKLLAGLLDVPYDELRQREAARRHRRLIALAAASSIGFLLMGGLAIFAMLSRNEAVRQREVADQRTLTAERTLDFVKQMFRVSDPSEARGANITAREVVDRGASMLESGLDDEPAVKADLGITLAEVYGALGLYQRSDELVRRSLKVRHGQRGMRARQLVSLGESQARLGDYEAAMRSFSRALAGLEGADAVTGALHSRILVGLGQAQSAVGNTAVADRTLREALRLDRIRLGDRHSDIARDLEALGLNLYYADELDAARPLIARALKLRLDLEGPASPSVADNLNTLASIAYIKGDLAGAERYFRQNVAFDERVLGRDHPDLATTLNNLARVLIEQRKFAEAGALLDRAIAISLKQRGETHDDMAYFFSNLALVRRHTNQIGEAEQLFGRALSAARTHRHRTLGPILADLAEIHCGSGRTKSGFQLLEQAREATARDYPDDPWRAAWVENIRGECLLRAGRRDEARSAIRGSTAPIAERWAPTTLFGSEAARRARGI